MNYPPEAGVEKHKNASNKIAKTYKEDDKLLQTMNASYQSTTQRKATATLWSENFLPFVTFLEFCAQLQQLCNHHPIPLDKMLKCWWRNYIHHYLGNKNFNVNCNINPVTQRNEPFEIQLISHEHDRSCFMAEGGRAVDIK